jgi:hypothetical protein
MKKDPQGSSRTELGSVVASTRGSYGPNMETLGLWTKPGLQG